MHNEAVEAGITVVNECGVDPGITVLVLQILFNLNLRNHFFIIVRFNLMTVIEINNASQVKESGNYALLVFRY